MRYKGDRDTELINMIPMRSRFNVLYIDLVFISCVVKLAIRSSCVLLFLGPGPSIRIGSTQNR
jgi:hypothetical protein